MKAEAAKNKISMVIEDDSDSNSNNEEFTSEIKALMVSNPKKIFKKFFSKFKGNKFNRGFNRSGSLRGQKSSSENIKDVRYKLYQKEAKKVEKRILGDFGYDCNYGHWKNHFQRSAC